MKGQKYGPKEYIFDDFSINFLYISTRIQTRFDTTAGFAQANDIRFILNLHTRKNISWESLVPAF